MGCHIGRIILLASGTEYHAQRLANHTQDRAPNTPVASDRALMVPRYGTHSKGLDDTAVGKDHRPLLPGCCSCDGCDGCHPDDPSIISDPTLQLSWLAPGG